MEKLNQREAASKALAEKEVREKRRAVAQMKGKKQTSPEKSKRSIQRCWT